MGVNAIIGNIALCVVHSISQDASSISGLGVGTWFQLTRRIINGNGAFVYVFGGIITSAAITVTVNFAGSTAASATILEVANGSLVIDAYSTADENNGANTPQIDQFTTITNGDLLVGVGARASNATVSTNPSGYTMAAAQISTGVGLSVGYQLVPAAGSVVKTNWSLSATATNMGLVLALRAAGHPPRPRLIQTSGNQASATSVAVKISPTLGNVLIAKAAAQVAANGVTVSDGSNTWHRAGSVDSSDVAAEIEIWYAVVTTAGSLTITSSSAGANNSLVVEEWQGISGVLNAAGAGNSSTGNATVTTGNVTTTYSDCLLVAATATNGGTLTSGSPTDSFASSGGIRNADIFELCIHGAYEIVAATGTYSTGWTIDSSTKSWAAMVVAFQVPVAGYPHGPSVPPTQPVDWRAVRIYAQAGRPGNNSSPFVPVLGAGRPPTIQTRQDWNAVQIYAQAGNGAWSSSPNIGQIGTTPPPIETQQQWSALKVYAQAGRSDFAGGVAPATFQTASPRPSLMQIDWRAVQIYAQAGNGAWIPSPLPHVLGGPWPPTVKTRTNWNAVDIYAQANGVGGWSSFIPPLPPPGPLRRMTINASHAVQTLTIRVIAVVAGF